MVYRLTDRPLTCLEQYSQDAGLSDYSRTARDLGIVDDPDIIRDWSDERIVATADSIQDSRPEEWDEYYHNTSFIAMLAREICKRI